MLPAFYTDLTVLRWCWYFDVPLESEMIPLLKGTTFPLGSHSFQLVFLIMAKFRYHVCHISQTSREFVLHSVQHQSNPNLPKKKIIKLNIDVDNDEIPIFPTSFNSQCQPKDLPMQELAWTIIELMKFCSLLSLLTVDSVNHLKTS